MEDATAIMSLPDDPAILKQIIATRTYERDEATRLREESDRRREESDRRREEAEIKALRFEVELLRLRKWYYGPKADRLQTPGDVAQMLLQFATELESQPVNPGDLPPGQTPASTQASPSATQASPSTADPSSVRRVGRGRRNLATFDHLPVTRQVHDLPEDQKPCPCCGQQRCKIGEESSWQVEYIPGHFERIEHVQIKYACKT